MPRRRDEVTDREIRDTAQRRIRIPQPLDRPIRLLQRVGIQSRKYRPNFWWFVEHRRGIHRPLIGEDPLEARAVTEDKVRGTLPERIVYRWLTSRLRMIPDVDFDFQSSLQGGRMELGGILADFLFRNLGLVIQVQGPTHALFLRSRKDEEQRQILAEMGYTVYEIETSVILNEDHFEDTMRRIFAIRPGYNQFAYIDSGEGELDPTMMKNIYDSLLRTEALLEGYLQGGI